ncbi:FAD-linked oxidoreductase domain protein [Mycobacterium xenopi 3993]|nr:FAD-linked oxidoreductase domain protein [Mycobacterium xenopi 3993]
MNGEGIDYGLEAGRLAVHLLGSGDLSAAWPALLQQHYSRAFSVARRLALLLTFPGFCRRRPGRDAFCGADGRRGAGDGQPGQRRRRRPAGAAVARQRVASRLVDRRKPFS